VFVIEGVTLNAFLKNACEAIDRLPNVLERNGVGRPRFDSKSRIIAVLVKAWIGRSYRDTEAYLYDNKEAHYPLLAFRFQTTMSFVEPCLFCQNHI
jgi:hypothetical protein